MLIEVYEEDDCLVGTIELDAPPQIGSILKFSIPDASVVDRYKVVGVEYAFETRNVGQALLTMKTSVVGVRCLVDQIEHNHYEV